MILHIPIISKQDGQVRVAARLETESAIPNLPAELWYQFPERLGPNLSVRADGFAATALLTAMYIGEDLDIRAAISPKLAYNLLEYRSIFHAWFPKIYRMIDVRYEKVEAGRDDRRTGGVGTAFSGGVDSFFTLWTQLAQNQPIVEARVTHGLFMHGFDVRLDELDTFQAITQKYERLFNDLGLDLISASTNAHQFSEYRIDWSLFFGAPLIGAATFLSPLFQKFYVPSWIPYNEQTPNGSSALSDHLLSTENLEIIHHGASTNRFEKISLLAQWPVTHELLRVCANQVKSGGLQNCSHCHKCYLTMATLSLIGSLPAYTPFARKLTFWNYLHWGTHTHMSLPLTKDIRRRALKSGRIGMALGLTLAMAINVVLKAAIALLKVFLPQTLLYRFKLRLYKSGSNETG